MDTEGESGGERLLLKVGVEGGAVFEIVIQGCFRIDAPMAIYGVFVPGANAG